VDSRQIDYRRPELRQGVFLDFYEFHLKYRAHPGGVYYLMPYLKEHYGWSQEEALWFAFLNGNTQNPVTSLILHRQAPTPDKAPALITFYKANYERLAFDTDRRYHKKSLEDAVIGYLSLVGESQERFWANAASRGFSGVWKAATSIPTFGRLSAYSYSEYLRIMGVDFDCDSLMLEDRSGSKSHRNGMCKVLGLDQFDWHDSNPGFDGVYSNELISVLNNRAAGLLWEMKQRAQGQDWAGDVSYFTMESALCTYKSWHRPNRRYPNVYNDMLYYRIRDNQAAWPEEDLTVFWEARKHYLPDYLRLEDNPTDPGVVPVKQNHYRETGQVVMMNRDFPHYQNDFNDKLDAGGFPIRTK
jgi:hypothetical protein